MSPSVIRVLEDLSALSGSIGAEGVEVLRRVLGAVYAELHDQVKRGDFDELKKVVTGMAEAQDRLVASQASADASLTRVEAAIDRLTEAQVAADARLTRVEAAIDRLTEAQVAADARLTRVEAAIDRLTEAQARTEQVLDRLTRSQEALCEEVGGIARNTAFFLEDRAYLGLPLLLEERLGITTTGRLTRTFVDVPGRRLEVNIWGQGRRRDGTPVRIVGETKLQLGRKHLRDFERRLELLGPTIGDADLVPVLVASQAEPEIVAEAESRGWLVVFSFDVEDANDRRRTRSMPPAA